MHATTQQKTRVLNFQRENRMNMGCMPNDGLICHQLTGKVNYQY